MAAAAPRPVPSRDAPRRSAASASLHFTPFSARHTCPLKSRRGHTWPSPVHPRARCTPEPADPAATAGHRARETTGSSQRAGDAAALAPSASRKLWPARRGVCRRGCQPRSWGPPAEPFLRDLSPGSSVTARSLGTAQDGPLGPCRRRSQRAKPREQNPRGRGAGGQRSAPAAPPFCGGWGAALCWRPLDPVNRSQERQEPTVPRH